MKREHRPWPQGLRAPWIALCLCAVLACLAPACGDDSSGGAGGGDTNNATTSPNNAGTSTNNGTSTSTNNGTSTSTNGATTSTNNDTTDVGVDTDLPDTDEPDVDEPDTDEPDTDLPDTDEPDTDLPDTDEPDAELPDADEPDTDLPDAEPDAEPDADEPDVPVVESPFPDQLNVHWVNLGDGDRVTFGKKIVVEFEPPDDKTLPETWQDQQAWNRMFPARVFQIDEDGERIALPIKQSWRGVDTSRRFRPSILIEPLPQGWPKPARLEVEVGMGEAPALVRSFRTLPTQFDDYLEVQVTVPMRDCATCFPYDVDMFVFLPPGYIDPERPEWSNPAPHLPDEPFGDAVGGNPDQRYPVSVLMHTAGAYEGNRVLATSAGQRMASGVMEPMIYVLPNARLDPDVCPDHPEVQSQNCHTRFVGLWVADDKIFSYMDWVADDMRQYVREHFRIRGSEGTEITDEELYRRSHSLYGLSAGGYGVMINAFGRPDAYYATVAIVPGVVSGFNPYAQHGEFLRPRDSVCPHPNNTDYPLVRYGLGYRDYSGVDPSTDRRYSVQFDERRISAGARNCYQGLPETSHELVRGGLCRLDIACQVDPEAPSYASNARLIRDVYPYHGNIYFDTAIFDTGGPPAAFMEVDELLDRAGIPHTFRYEDRGALFHRWEAIYDRGLGYEYIQNPNGLPLLRGNFPGPGSIYPFLSNAMEGVGNIEFNNPHNSEYTVSAIDPDRDQYIYFNDPFRPEMTYELDNCPEVYNPDQGDKDNDGIGDLCDDDIDGDGLLNEEDPCNWPDVPMDPLDPDSPMIDGCAGDVDGDGIPDDSDICPQTFDPLQRDTDYDGLGDACDDDSDDDGVPDVDDNCPTEINEDQADLDGNGLGDICDPTCLLRPLSDADGDGVACSEDCNDANRRIYPGNTEVCGDGIDNNCDGQIDEDGCEGG